MDPHSQFSRDRQLERLTGDEGTWDLVVIGGGATGVGIAVDAATINALGGASTAWKNTNARMTPHHTLRLRHLRAPLLCTSSRVVHPAITCATTARVSTMELGPRASLTWASVVETASASISPARRPLWTVGYATPASDNKCQRRRD